jgi:hypothetical protein
MAGSDAMSAVTPKLEPRLEQMRADEPCPRLQMANTRRPETVLEADVARPLGVQHLSDSFQGGFVAGRLG